MANPNEETQLGLIKQILKESYFPNIQHIMEEKDVMEKKIVTHKNTNYLLARFDPNQEKLFPYFNSNSGLNKICDYILFVETGNSLYIFLIELKNSNTPAKKQLDAGECFAKFLICSGKRIGLPLTDNIFYRKVKVKNRTKSDTVQQELSFQDGVIPYNKKEFNIWDIIDAVYS